MYTDAHACTHTRTHTRTHTHTHAHSRAFFFWGTRCFSLFHHDTCMSAGQVAQDEGLWLDNQDEVLDEIGSEAHCMICFSLVTQKWLKTQGLWLDNQHEVRD